MAIEGKDALAGVEKKDELFECGRRTTSRQRLSSDFRKVFEGGARADIRLVDVQQDGQGLLLPVIFAQSFHGDMRREHVVDDLNDVHNDIEPVGVAEVQFGEVQLDLH